MAKHVGRNGVLKSGATDIAHVRSWEFTESAPQIDLTVMGESFADQDSGLPAISGSFSGLLDPSDAGQDTLTNGAEFTLAMYIDGETTGDTYYSVSIAITEITRRGSHDGAVEFSCSWVGRSVVTEGTVA